MTSNPFRSKRFKFAAAVLLSASLLMPAAMVAMPPRQSAAAAEPAAASALGSDNVNRFAGGGGGVYSAAKKKLYKFSKAKENEYNAVKGDGEAYGLYEMNPDGTGRRLIRSGSGGSLNLLGDRLYYQDDTNAIVTVKLDGTGFRKLTTEKKSDSISGIIVEGSWIYYQTSGDKMYTDKIFRVKTDGSSRKMLATGAIYVDLTLAGDYLWVNSFGKVTRIKKDGSQKTDFKNYTGIAAADGSKLYLQKTKNNRTVVVQVNASGAEVRQVFAESDAASPRQNTNLTTEVQFVKDDWVYYSRQESGQVDGRGVIKSVGLYRVKADGTGNQLLYGGEKGNIDVRLGGYYNGRVFYWKQTRISNGWNFELWSMLPDGKDKQRFLELTDAEAKELTAMQGLQKKYAPYRVEDHYRFFEGDKLAVSYQAHDDGTGWTVNIPNGDNEEHLKLFQKVVAEFGRMSFTAEQIQQIRDLVAIGEQSNIRFTIDGMEIMVQHRFAGEPQGYLVLTAFKKKS